MAHEVDCFAHEVSTILLIAKPGDRVLIKMESPGGVVYGYGLLAQQILRLRKAELEVTVCCDKVAASGGYLASCIAHKIIASPFAIIGSIGVVATIANINKLLERFQIDVMELTAGEQKRPLSMLGPVTEEGKQHTEQKLKAIHIQFMELVKKYRQQVDLDVVATGDIWTGEHAKTLGLVDEIATSDEIIFLWVKEIDVYSIEAKKMKSWSDKIKDGWVSMASWLVARGNQMV